MNITDEQVKLMRKNAFLRPWTERLEMVCGEYNKEGMRVLDIGINGDVYPGGNAYLFPNAEYETLDINKDTKPTFVADIRNMPFDNNTFDLIICTCVLEHVLEDRKKALEELYRVSRGRIVLGAPTKITEKEIDPATPVTMDDIIEALPGVSVRAKYYDDFMLAVITK